MIKSRKCFLFFFFFFGALWVCVQCSTVISACLLWFLHSSKMLHCQCNSSLPKMDSMTIIRIAWLKYSHLKNSISDVKTTFFGFLLAAIPLISSRNKCDSVRTYSYNTWSPLNTETTTHHAWLTFVFWNSCAIHSKPHFSLSPYLYPFLSLALCLSLSLSGWTFPWIGLQKATVQNDENKMVCFSESKSATIAVLLK